MNGRPSLPQKDTEIYPAGQRGTPWHDERFQDGLRAAERDASLSPPVIHAEALEATGPVIAGALARVSGSEKRGGDRAA